MATGTEYWRAPEVETIAERLIAQHHQHLEGVRIHYLYRTPTPRRAGQLVLGKARRVGGLAAHLVGLVGREEVDGPVAFFVIEVAFDPWQKLTETQRAALVDHELCHLDVVEDDDVDGGRRLTIRGHDLEEFAAVVSRHGLWRPSVEAFAGAAIGAQLQLEVAEPAEVGGPDG